MRRSLLLLLALLVSFSFYTDAGYSLDDEEECDEEKPKKKEEDCDGPPRVSMWEDVQKILDNKYMPQDKKYSEVATKLLSHTVDAYQFGLTSPQKALPEDWILMFSSLALPIASATCLCRCCGNSSKHAPANKKNS